MTKTQINIHFVKKPPNIDVLSYTPKAPEIGQYIMIAAGTGFYAGNEYRTGFFCGFRDSGMAAINPNGVDSKLIAEDTVFLSTDYADFPAYVWANMEQAR
jgi:hypothetical protein